MDSCIVNRRKQTVNRDKHVLATDASYITELVIRHHVSIIYFMPVMVSARVTTWWHQAIFF